MKKNIEEEFVLLESMINDLSLTDPLRAGEARNTSETGRVSAVSEARNSKTKTSLLKQLEVVRKCAKPRKTNKNRGQNQNSGLQKPVIISEEMAEFANWSPDELHSRVEVTKKICTYVKEKDLQKPENKRLILLDSVLKKLLRFEDNELSYPHIQKYIGVHFTNPPKLPVSSKIEEKVAESEVNKGAQLSAAMVEKQ